MKKISPNCKIALKKKHNILAIISFILSLTFPASYLLEIIISDYLSAVLVLLAILLENIAFILGIVALAIGKNYEHDYMWASITGIVFPIVATVIFVPKIIEPINSVHPDESLNTTFLMDWNGQQQYQS